MKKSAKPKVRKLPPRIKVPEDKVADLLSAIPTAQLAAEMKRREPLSGRAALEGNG